jgi:2-polyprenyl-6-methoxyphenol hydroxylase-like FAD-dependent oxidoreductase
MHRHTNDSLCSHGHDILLLERRELLQILYDSLPDKSYIKLGTPVKDIVEQVNGIEVVLGDGHKIQGDIVIGADGAYSRVREVMWTQANSRLGRPMRFTASEKKSEKNLQSNLSVEDWLTIENQP